MSANFSSLKRLFSTAGDMFTVFLIGVMLLLPAMMAMVAIVIVATWMGIDSGVATLFAGGVVFPIAYLTMVATWLFKSYGARPGFIKFCHRHQRFGAMVMWTVSAASAIWAALGAAGDAADRWLDRMIGWVGSALGVLLIALVIGGILFAVAGALSAPWWAIVIIWLLLRDR